jgi:hypothetical protein
MDLFAAGKGGDRSHLAYREVPVLTPNKGMFRFCDAAYIYCIAAFGFVFLYVARV